MRPLLLAVLATLAVSGCNITRGSLHEVPSRGGDLPFAVGAYVRDSLGGWPTVNEALVFRDDGTVLALTEAGDLGVVVAADGFRAQEGTYLVVPGGVELRVRVPDEAGFYVETNPAAPVSTSSFTITYHSEYVTGPRTAVHTYVLRRP